MIKALSVLMTIGHTVSLCSVAARHSGKTTLASFTNCLSRTRTRSRLSSRCRVCPLADDLHTPRRISSRHRLFPYASETNLSRHDGIQGREKGQNPSDDHTVRMKRLALPYLATIVDNRTNEEASVAIIAESQQRTTSVFSRWLMPLLVAASWPTAWWIDSTSPRLARRPTCVRWR